MELAGVNDQMRWCCKKREFRAVTEQKEVPGPTGPCVSTTTRCVVCGNRHYLIEVPPIPLAVNGAQLG